MNLSLEKNVKVAVEVNGKIFISSLNGVLYQNIKDDEIFLFIKDNGGNQVKLKIEKTQPIEEEEQDDNNKSESR